jgi:hypothetical protein
MSTTDIDCSPHVILQEFENEHSASFSVVHGINVIENQEIPTPAEDDEVQFVGSSSTLNNGVFVELKKIPIFGTFHVTNLKKNGNSPTATRISALMTIFQIDWGIKTNANMKMISAALRPQLSSTQVLLNGLLQEIINSKNDRSPYSEEPQIIDDAYHKLYSTQASTDREDDFLPDIEAEIIRELSKPALTRAFSNPVDKSLPEIMQQFKGSYTLSFDFYERLQPRHWLSNTHIEVYVSLLLGFASDYPRVDPSFMACGHQFTILPPTIFTLAVKENTRGGASVNYERAAWVFDRRPGSRAQFEGPYRFKKGVDHIMCPFNRYGNHWALMIIDGPDRTIAYADSKWTNGSNMLRIMLYFLGQMAAKCTESNCTDTPDWLRHFDAQEWTLIDLGDKIIPQQDNCDDCGVFVCMIMTIYMFMKPPYCIFSEDRSVLAPFKRSVEGFRRKMIRLFFDKSIDSGTFEEFLDNC